MKKVLFTTLAVAFSLLVMAQEKTKQKEVGLSFSNLDEFGITYKVGTQKAMWRFNTLLLTGGKTTMKYPEQYRQVRDEYSDKDFGLNLMVGREYRTSIDDNFEFRYGFDLSFSNYKLTHEDKTMEDSHDWRKTVSKESSYGFNLVFGFNYVFKNKLVVGVEALPNVSIIDGEIKKSAYYGDFETEKSDISGSRYGLKNSSVLLTLAYRF